MTVSSFRTGAAALIAVASAAALAVTAPPDPAPGTAASGLAGQHQQLRAQLAASPFGRPIVLQSADSVQHPHGDVFAEVRHPFATVRSSLQAGQAWCDVMLLQTNVRRCEVAGGAGTPTLRVSFVRKSEQKIDEAQQIDFRFSTQAATADHLALQMTAASGPVGTSDFSLKLEAVPLDAGHSFLHLSYDYANGVAARLATDAYLATAGRNKLGFSQTGRDAAGHPTYVTGIRGVAERNTMRYYLAIEAVLAASGQPAAQRPEQRLANWFAAIERYPAQLKEMERANYLAMKRQDLQQSPH